MGRFWLGICLMAVLLGGGLWVASATSALQTPVYETLEEAAQQSLAGNMDKATALARRAQKDWQEHWHRTAAVADHSPMDEIDGLFAQMDVYAQGQDPTEFAAHCARLSKLVEAVKDAQSLTWWNLL